MNVNSAALQGSGSAAEKTQTKAFAITSDNVVTALHSAGHLPAGSDQLETIKLEEQAGVHLGAAFLFAAALAIFR